MNNNMNFNDNDKNKVNNNFDSNNSSSFGSNINTQNNTENNQNNGSSPYGQQPNGYGTYNNNNGYDAPNYNNQYNQYNSQNYNGYNNRAYNQGGYTPNEPNQNYYYQQPINSFEDQNRLNRSNGTASTSLVFGIIGLVTAFLCYGILLTPLWSILAIVKGSKAQKLAYPQRASAKAMVGKIFGIVSLAFTAFIWVLFVFIFILAMLEAM